MATPTPGARDRRRRKHHDVSDSRPLLGLGVNAAASTAGAGDPFQLAPFSGASFGTSQAAPGPWISNYSSFPADGVPSTHFHVPVTSPPPAIGPFASAAPGQLAPAESGIFPASRTAAPPASADDIIRAQEQALFLQTHQRRKEINQTQQASKGTGENYQRHVRNYEKYWDALETALCAQDPHRIRMPAYPITASKVFLFIEYEMSRPQMKRAKSQDGADQFALGTSVGVQSILQAVSALEQRRFDDEHSWSRTQHPEAHVSLRNDKRIRTLEAGARQREAQRVDKAQKLKAAGSTADTYTQLQLRDVALHGLRSPTTTAKLEIETRDRAMLLLSTQMATRGEIVRSFLLSDMFLTLVDNPAAGDGKVLPVLSFFASHGKTNPHGRIDEFGALRHKNVEQCCIGALALWFFVLFHPRITKQEPPDFAPDFSISAQHDGFGVFGRRPWYEFLVFGSAKDRTKEMSYQNHNSRVKGLQKATGVTISKGTHGGREYAAQAARTYGASVEDTKALGGWNEPGSFRNCYDRTPPVEAYLGAASFIASRRDAYFVSRSALEPPEELLAQVFPWIEAEEEALRQRVATHNASKDIALEHFLDALKWLRRVLLQDCAVLHAICPESLIFRYAPLDSPTFLAFAEGAAERIADVERAVRLQFEKLPEHVSAAMQALLQEFGLRQREDQVMNRQVLDLVQQELRSIRSQSPPPDGPSTSRAAIAGAAGARFVAVSSAVNTPSQPLPMPAALIPEHAAQTQAAASTESRIPLQTATNFLSTGPNPALYQPPAPLLPCMPALVTAPPPAVFLPMPEYTSTGGSHPLLVQDWNRICGLFPLSQLATHAWIAKDSKWIPVYVFSKRTGVLDLWREWHEGVDGHLPVLSLNRGWDAAWRPKGSLSTGHSQRQKVITFINELKTQRAWTDKHLFQFFDAVGPTCEKHRTLYNFILKAADAASLRARASKHRF